MRRLPIATFGAPFPYVMVLPYILKVQFTTAYRHSIKYLRKGWGDMSGSSPTRPRRRYSYSKAPLRVYWEITRACSLGCPSCPIRSTPNRHPRELSTDDAKGVLNEIHAFSTPPPELIIMGGDPLCRNDLEELLAYANEQGIETTLWLGPTDNLTPTRLKSLQSAGATTVALTVDDLTIEGHARRHTPGAYGRTWNAMQMVLQSGMKLHITTPVTDGSLVEVPHVYDTIRSLNVDQWNLLFLVRESERLQHINPLQAEFLFNWIYDVSRTAKFPIEVLEAPQYRRIVFQRLREEGVPLNDIPRSPQATHFGLRDGNGLLFLSHVGDVYPAPDFPLVAGNVRGRSLISLYRRSRLFRDLRDPAQLKGDCGRCQFRRICGGSRARAYAENNDWTVSDPLCSYNPIGITRAH